MKIKKCNTDQFAGVRNMNISFEPGMNVVVGGNEAGKSTMISVLMNAFITPPAKNPNELQDKFPTNGAEFINAFAEISEGDRKYLIKKEWHKSKKGAISFDSADCGLNTGEKAEEEFAKFIKYGPALYKNLIFGLQSSNADVLNWCWKFFSDNGDKDILNARKYISDVLSAAGGIDKDKFLKLIDDKMTELWGSSKCWDFERHAPRRDKNIVRTYKNPWSRGIGEITDIYYQYEKKEDECRKAKDDILRLANLNEDIKKLSARKNEINELIGGLSSQKGAANALSYLKSIKNDLQSSLKDLKDWKITKTALKEADELNVFFKEEGERNKKKQLSDVLENIVNLKKEIEAIKAEISLYKNLSEDFSKIKNLPSNILMLETRLSSAKLHTKISLKNGHKAELNKSDGSTLIIEKEYDEDISGYLNINIPEVAELTVSPQNVNVVEIKNKISDMKSSLNEVLLKYGADTFDALERKKDEINAKINRLASAEQELSKIKPSNNPEEIREQIKNIAVNENIVIPSDLNEKIDVFVKNYKKVSLNELIDNGKGKDELLRRRYDSIEKLSEKIDKLQEEEKRISADLEKSDIHTNLTAEEIEKQINKYEKESGEIEKRREEILTEIGSYKPVEANDLAEWEKERDELKEKYINKEKLYYNYKTIKEDFENLCKNEDNKLKGFYDKLNNYLSYFAGREFLAEEGADFALISGGNKITKKEMLSKGTEKMLLLSFRLALYEYYFPEGGAFIIMDDDLLDMDEGRRERSAEILKKFSERNQVIYTTCDPKFAQMLGGNRINL